MAHSLSLAGSDRGLHIVFLGDADIGQSELLKYFRYEEKGTSSPSQSSSLFPEHQSYILDQVIEAEPFRVRVTDSAGLKLYDKVRKPMLRTAHLVVLCFSTARRATLESLEREWIPLIKSISFTKNQEDAYFLKPYIILGLQTDIRASSRASVSTEEGQEFARSVDAISYLECGMRDAAETLEALRMKILTTAKESYLFRWQQRRVKRSLRAQSDVDREEIAASVDRYMDEALTVEEDVEPLSREVIKQNLSCLGVTPYMAHAYLQLDVPDLGLTSCDALRGYPNLQYLDLSNNHLRSLEPLGELPFLLRLNASRNQIVRTQSFGPPRHLETLDLSYNMIGEIGDFRCHRHLRELSLRGNFISEIDSACFQKNRRLKMLDLSENHISAIENLENCPLEALYIAQNQLKTLSGIEALTQLSVLNVRGNFISSLAPLEGLALRKVCVTENKIKATEELSRLPTTIADLYVTPNPVSELPFFRLQILRLLPHLRTLDDVPATPQEKVKANVAFGDDLGRQEELFEAILPREQFLDRRLITEELLQARELEIFGFVGRTAPEDDDGSVTAVE
ncbi:unnamed protein product [Amoebophrya sp. A25]|nr:unnamed protein product [Amoebophrya sp. A25]|eukprot:GSA25T00010611001.1